MINETVLPNPFKQTGDHLDHVMAAIEAELDEYKHERLPTFLNDAFLLKLQSEVLAASRQSPALAHQAARIVRKLQAHWPPR
jgi:hypothetical protein